MTLEILGHPFVYQMENTLRMFYPQEDITIVDTLQQTMDSRVIRTEILLEDEALLLRVSLFFPKYHETKEQRLPCGTGEPAQKRCLNQQLFLLLVEQTGIHPPWGTLIGIRPVRLLHQMLEQGSTVAEAGDAFLTERLVSPSKTWLALAVLENQQELLKKNHSNAFSLYISIPFCPSRCLYCSFVSHDIQRAMHRIPDYVEALCQELKETAKLARELGLELQTIYIGGGTPTTLAPQWLEKILQTVDDNFGFDHLLEYTVEAGRPDTITEEKLQVLRKHGVDRISINPQTMQDAVLVTIGRHHTTEQTLQAFSLARSMGFKSINMDLIAGLPGETAESFSKGLQQVISLSPENITVHTLTIKRSSRLWEEGEFLATSQHLPALLEAAEKSLTEADYHPYYLYRQKGTIENLENIGYSKPSNNSYYNVYSMEEAHTILAVGAGGVSKLCAKLNQLERVYNFKYPDEYLDDFQEIISRKSVVRSFYERNN